MSRDRRVFLDKEMLKNIYIKATNNEQVEKAHNDQERNEFIAKSLKDMFDNNESNTIKLKEYLNNFFRPFVMSRYTYDYEPNCLIFKIKSISLPYICIYTIKICYNEKTHDPSNKSSYFMTHSKEPEMISRTIEYVATLTLEEFEDEDRAIYNMYKNENPEKYPYTYEKYVIYERFLNCE